MNEIWKNIPIPGYSSYKVSNLGRIKSYKYWNTDRTHERILKSLDTHL